MWRIAGFCSALLALLLAASVPAALVDPADPGSYTVSSMQVTVSNTDTGSAVMTVIHYPVAGEGVDPSGAPHPAIVLAHGFMAQASYYEGNAKHLASWGYLVAVPDFPSEVIENRVSDVRHVLTYLASANREASSPLYGKVDTARLGVIGHSLGGVTAMAVAARDARVQAAVALDPTNPEPGMGVEPWAYEAEAPSITAPLLVLGAPAQPCNASAGYNSIYPLVGSWHKARRVLANGSHCDYMITDSTLSTMLCGVFCGRSYSAERATISSRYATAWFNYYLLGRSEDYAYVYGAEAEADVLAGRMIGNDVQTQPRHLTVATTGGGIHLNWAVADYPIIVGYNVYRRTESGQYTEPPYAQVGRQGAYTDPAATPGQRYYYTVRSRDTAGNVHAPSEEVSAVRGAQTTPTPTVTPGPSPTVTPTWEAHARVYLPLLER